MIPIVVIICLVIVAMIWLSSSRGKSKQAKSEAVSRATAVTHEPRSVSTGILDDEVEDVYIAGIGHHCTMGDIGPFSGVVFNETDNPADKKAMAIGCHRRKKILGYVPNAILDEYRKWCRREKRPCVGYIFWDGERLRGRCRVYPSRKEEDMVKFNEDGEKYVEIVAKHFGWELNDDWSLK